MSTSGATSKGVKVQLYGVCGGKFYLSVLVRRKRGGMGPRGRRSEIGGVVGIALLEQVAKVLLVHSGCGSSMNA